MANLHRVRRLGVAVGALAATSTLLIASVPAGAQPIAIPPTGPAVPLGSVPAGAQPIAIPPTGPAVPAASTARMGQDARFSVVHPAFVDYFQQHGGLRTLGAPISHDFQLQGSRVQIFERQVVQQQADGSVRALDLLGDAMPLVHADGATFPTPDPDIVANEPPLGAADYQVQALTAIDAGLLDDAAPDVWNDLPVNFGMTYRMTTSCDDLQAASACDDRRLLRAAVDVWGLPTGRPTVDPNNPDLIYLSFQRGIMQFSQSTMRTLAVPVGSWFKRVLIGTDLPLDLQVDVAASRFYAQYKPALPLGLSRPAELPATSLAAAFGDGPVTISAAGSSSSSTLPSPVVGAAFPFSVNSSADPLAQAGQVQPSLTPTPSNPVTGVSTPVTGLSTLPATPAAAVAAVTDASTPAAMMGPDPCAGDEQIYFAPTKPYVGTDVLVAATSARHHDVRAVRLGGPVKPGTVSERAGLSGWVWEWTIAPPIEGWYEFTFYVDGARACSTSGFNAQPTFGTTATPVATATATLFPSPTAIASPSATPTATPIAGPSLATTGAADPPANACSGQLLRLSGQHFGQTQGELAGNVIMVTPSGERVPTIISWTNTVILMTVPPALTAGSYQIVVTTSSGASTPLVYQIGNC